MKYRFALAAIALIALSGCGTITKLENTFGLSTTPAQTNESIKAEAAAASPTSSAAATTSATTAATVPNATTPATGAAAEVPSNAEKIVFDIRAGYDAVFLAPAAHYSHDLPKCGSPGAGAVCADPKVVAQLKKADIAAHAALDAAEAIARGKQPGTFTKALAAANAAIGAAEKILADYGIN